MTIVATLLACLLRLLPGVVGDGAGASATPPATTVIPATGADATLATDDAATTPPPVVGPIRKQRVYIIVDRREEAMGEVESEDEEVIVIRYKDEVKSFAKARVLSIVRLVDPLPGQRGRIILRDGHVRQGTIIEDSFERVLLDIEGIRSEFPREIVHCVELEPTFEQQHARMCEGLTDDSHVQRLMLARWLYEQRRYEMSREALVHILERTEMPEAEQLLKLVDAQLALGVRRPAAPAGGASSGEPGRGSRAGRVDQRDLLPTRLLTPEDVNLIRVYELDLRDPPAVAIEEGAIRTLIETYAASDLIPASSDGRTALLRAEPLDIVRLMFRLKARELYPSIQVLTEPPNLNLFRQRVHNAWVINNCATSRCHGGVDAGRLFLHNRNHKDERVRYTNLMILDSLEIDGRPLINYDEPIMSLLIQYALPRTEARLPHPDVPGWRPAITPNNQRILNDAVTWIRNMYQPRPTYPIDYEPPDLSHPDARDIVPDRQDR